MDAISSVRWLPPWRAVACTCFFVFNANPNHSENHKMKHHPAWLAAGLLVFVVLACNPSKKNLQLQFNLQFKFQHQRVNQGSGSFLKEIHMARTMAVALLETRPSPLRPVIGRFMRCNLERAKAGTPNEVLPGGIPRCRSCRRCPSTPGLLDVSLGR